MESDWIVKIEYKNKKLETVIEREYPFDQYTDLIGSELMGVITDVENVFYKIEGGKQRDEWSEDNKQMFRTIKHKLLDHANSIRRLPNTLNYKGIPANTMSFSQYLAAKLNGDK